ncbi:MAG: small nuclear ribonucleoprotein [Candidatus Thermoplasmatota archaeon]|nr:small nuclear ribonucleoprotein [Candidatus Thermoplasmatota archaeon]MCL5730558.1 small nuclear ribonucleoprotein [Candidatus Thermoplasmatota archaeon]
MAKTSEVAIRPMEMLRKSLEKNIMVEVRSKRVYSGILEGYDVYMNLVIRNASETINDENRGIHQRILVRGDNIIYVSPSGGDEN